MTVRMKSKRDSELPFELQHDGTELAEGWDEASLDGLVYLAGRIGWRGLTAAEYTPTGPMFLSVPNLNHGDEVDFTSVNHISQERYDESPEIKLQNSDILLTKDGAGIGKVGFVTNLPSPATVNSSLLVIRALEAFEPKYLFYCLKGPEFQGLAKERITGSTTPHLFQKDIKNLRIRIAPLAEQRRIVSKLEMLLGKVSSNQQRLARVPRLLKRFRQSVLAAACSGRLTADWREENPEPASTEFDSGDACGGIPESWVIATVRDVIEGLKYGTSRKCDYPKMGVPVLRIPNIAAGVIDHSDIKHAELEPTELEQLRLLAGDVLLIRSNGSVSLVGKTALVRDTEQGFAYAGYLIRLRPNRAKITPEFLNAVLGSYDVRLQIEIPARSTSGVNNINSEEVRALRIPLPPQSEQQEIVRRVEKLFAFADQIEARLKHAQYHVDRLTQSILAKAFRGELVPTEAELARREGRDYEPASVLLDRIRNVQAKESSSTPKRSKTAGTRKARK